MATTTVAAAGTALALYYYSQRRACGADPDEGSSDAGEPAASYETYVGAHSAPRSFLEDLYFFAEGLRYTYGETLGRWRTADLLIGLAYLCRKEPEEHPLADIARHGRPYAQGLAGAERTAALEELARIERFFRYCSGLRERRPLQQRKYFEEVLHIADEDILRQELRAGVLKPSYLLARDSTLGAVVLAVRGTHSFKDAFTSLTGASKPHHVVDSNNVVLGYSHFGMLAAARWLKGELAPVLEEVLAANPSYRLYIIGHSLGGGTAAMLTMMLRERGGACAGATCVAIACPACMTLELARSCSAYVTTVVNGCDVIPTICPATADALRLEVMRSSWFHEFRSDVRSSAIVRAVEVGIRGVGSATATATSWTTARLASCVQRRPRGAALKRRKSDDALDSRDGGGDAAAADEAGGAASEGGDGDGDDEGGKGHGRQSAPIPLSTSAPAAVARGAAFPELGALPPSIPGPREPCGGGGAAGEWHSLAARRFSSIAQTVSAFTGRQALSLGRSVSAVSETATRFAATSGTTLMSAMWQRGAAAGGGQGARSAGHDSGGGSGSDSGGEEDARDAARGSGGAKSTRSRRRQAGGDVVAYAAEAAGAASATAGERRGADAASAPEPLEMDFEFDRFESMEVEVGAAAAVPPPRPAGGVRAGSGGARHSRQGSLREALTLEGSLEAEANVRMAEVAKAVSAAEAEERAAGPVGESHVVPAVIRPGGYGSAEGGGTGGGQGGGSAAAEATWRRTMYPAGRIMHLLPARLVAGMQPDPAVAGSGDGSGGWPEARMEEGDDYPSASLGSSPQGRLGMQLAAAAAARTAEPCGAERPLGGGEPGGGALAEDPDQLSSRELSLRDMLDVHGPGPLPAVASQPGTTLRGGPPAPPAQPPAMSASSRTILTAGSPAPEAMVLLEAVPQEAYGRIKLCRTVLSDHVIPCYLRSLESALEQI